MKRQEIPQAIAIFTLTAHLCLLSATISMAAHLKEGTVKFKGKKVGDKLSRALKR